MVVDVEVEVASGAFTGSSSFGEPCTHNLKSEYSGPWPKSKIKKYDQ